MKSFVIIFAAIILIMTANFLILYEMLGASLIFENYNNLFALHPELAIKSFGITISFLALFTLIVVYIFNKSEREIIEFDTKFFSNLKKMTS